MAVLLSRRFMDGTRLYYANCSAQCCAVAGCLMQTTGQKNGIREAMKIAAFSELREETSQFYTLLKRTM